MPALQSPRLKCVLLLPPGRDFDQLRHLVASSAKESGIAVVLVEEISLFSITETVFSDIATADLIIADASNASANIFYEVGLAHAMGKPLVFLVNEEIKQAPPLAMRFA